MTYTEQVIANFMRQIAQRQAELTVTEDPVTQQQLQHTIHKLTVALQEWNTLYNAGHKPN